MNRMVVRFLLAALTASPALAAQEREFTTVDHLPSPPGARVEVGGMGFLPDGRLVVSTRRGQVWLIEHPLAPDPKDARFKLFAEGLQEGLGLSVVDGQVYVLQRGELSRLEDADGDDRVERIETVANDWGVSGHYHEFAFGLPRDAQGNFYLSLNVSFGDPQWWHGRSTAPYRGWIVKVSPDGRTTPFASGFRSPCGLGMNAAGDLFETDNQGDWMPACPIFHVREGRFYGHPASLNWSEEYLREHRTASDTLPPERQREPAAIWIPYDWSRSAGNLVPAPAQNAFGPFEGQMFVAEMTNGLVLRADLEQVGGQYQGAVLLFRQHVGSAVRVAFAPDGSLFAGLTDRGWGGQPPGDGIARIRPTDRQALEIQRVHLVSDGFEVSFTEPLRDVPAADQARLYDYDYDYWWEYGSPVRRQREIPIEGLLLSGDGKRLSVRAKLQSGRVARLKLGGVVSQDGRALLHDEFAYTLNRLPGETAPTELVAKLVAPPPARETGNEGTLSLTRGEALDAWTGAGWRAARAATGAVALAPDPTRFEPVDPPAEPPPEKSAKEGAEQVEVAQTILLNDAGAGGGASDLVSRIEFGDCDVHLEFCLPKGGNSGVYLMGRYEVQLKDSSGVEHLTHGDCGGIYEGWGEHNAWPGRAPQFNAFRGPGIWHDLDIRFQAPRFDAAGQKLASARFTRVLINDTLMHEDVELPNPTRGGFEGPEQPTGPLRLQGDHSQVAYRNIVVRPRGAAPDASGWTRIFDGRGLGGWQISDGGAWRVENGEIVGSGARSHLFSPRGDYKNLEFRARAKISDGGNSGMYFRVAFGPGWPQGYEAQVNSTHADPIKTGSLYNLSPVRTQLIPPDTWFTQHVICRDEPAGVHVTILVDGVVVNDFVDAQRLHASGHVAFQQHHDGSVVRYKDVEVRELP
jgi:glucose/arabinose dehydrogenase